MLTSLLKSRFSSRAVSKVSGGKLWRKCTTSISFEQTQHASINISPKIGCPLGDAIFIPFSKGEATKTEDIKSRFLSLIPEGLSVDVKSLLTDVIHEGSFGGHSKNYAVRIGSSPGKHMVLVNLDESDPSAVAKSYGQTIADTAKQFKAKQVSIFLPSSIPPEATYKLFSGVIESSYEDKRYKKKPDVSVDDSDAANASNVIEELCVVGLANVAEKEVVAGQAKLAQAVSHGVTLARDLVGAPSNSKTPLAISAVARKLAKDFPSLTCHILDQHQCEELKMGAFLSVQKGSKFPPQFVHLTYSPPPSAAPSAVRPLKVALIGKGLTFDSGGYNLKVGANAQIEMMKVDMGGLSAVMGTARAVAELAPENMEVHFISAVCENMISENAMRPGDIVTASNGKTIEILNTDAEGRLTLADALVYADKLDVDVIIDLATLTGACVVALGEETAAVYSDHSQLMTALLDASERSGDDLWQLPLKKAYKKNIKSTMADIQNIGAKGGGSITAALFLQEFVTSNKQWAHIDMAGPVWDSRKDCSTGYGVKLLTDYLINQASK